MVRDRQHGPVIELNRFGIASKRSRKPSGNSSSNNNNLNPGNNNSSSNINAGGASHSNSNNNNSGEGGGRTVFAQMVSKMGLLTSECLLLPHRVWKVKFVGESVDDCGGGYSESIAEMCDELTAAGRAETELFCCFCNYEKSRTKITKIFVSVNFLYFRREFVNSPHSLK